MPKYIPHHLLFVSNLTSSSKQHSIQTGHRDGQAFWLTDQSVACCHRKASCHCGQTPPDPDAFLKQVVLTLLPSWAVWRKYLALTITQTEYPAPSPEACSLGTKRRGRPTCADTGHTGRKGFSRLITQKPHPLLNTPSEVHTFPKMDHAVLREIQNS